MRDEKIFRAIAYGISEMKDFSNSEEYKNGIDAIIRAVMFELATEKNIDIQTYEKEILKKVMSKRYNIPYMISGRYKNTLKKLEKLEEER